MPRRKQTGGIKPVLDALNYFSPLFKLIAEKKQKGGRRRSTVSNSNPQIVYNSYKHLERAGLAPKGLGIAVKALATIKGRKQNQRGSNSNIAIPTVLTAMRSLGPSGPLPYNLFSKIVRAQRTYSKNKRGGVKGGSSIKKLRTLTALQKWKRRMSGLT